MGLSEADVQAHIRLAVSKMGWTIWRNNVGVLKDARGVPVRYGLANDSARVNAVFKSADLIGIRPLVITQEMVGRTVGQFVSIECKAGNWTPGKDKHFAAQANWRDKVRLLGGYAIIATGSFSDE